MVLGFLVATNFTTGFELTGWNNADGGWINDQTRTDLEALEARLAGVDEDTPVIFVMDQEDRGQQVWGYTKLSGNTSRYGLPDGMIDQGYMYLGSLENLLQDSPTDPEGDAIEQGSCDPEEAKEALSGDIYTALSRETLCDVQANADGEPIIVVAQAFNSSGFNAEVASGAGRGCSEHRRARVRSGRLRTARSRRSWAASSRPPNHERTMHRPSTSCGS